ncbi:hypothetical protein [Paenibacillus sonchi]|uniref:hypothetical protein n=1 Tax=Paenibacillus sonchi TaxID=373687 RepID=UPI001E5B6CEE|nr:hypothetical protein [Paenibacillus sonchi]MCE3203432.1 hypothetical protein [Paenibacillus sonchi]
MINLNPKYYPPLKPYAEAAREVLKVMPELSGIETSVPADIAIQVHQVLLGLGTDNKDFAMDVSKMIFYGLHVEVNLYYYSYGEAERNEWNGEY